MVANRFGSLVLCFSDRFSFSRLSQWGLDEGFVKYFFRLRSNGKEKRVSFFLTFVRRPIPATYIPPTGNECGRKPIAMYVTRRSFPVFLTTSLGERHHILRRTLLPGSWLSGITFFEGPSFLGLAASHSSKDPPSLAYWLFASPHWTMCAGVVGSR